MVDHEEEDQQIDDLLYDFIKHIPQHEKKNVLKSLKLKFQRRRMSVAEIKEAINPIQIRRNSIIQNLPNQIFNQVDEQDSEEDDPTDESDCENDGDMGVWKKSNFEDIMLTDGSKDAPAKVEDGKANPRDSTASLFSFLNKILNYKKSGDNDLKITNEEDVTDPSSKFNKDESAANNAGSQQEGKLDKDEEAFYAALKERLIEEEMETLDDTANSTSNAETSGKISEKDRALANRKSLSKLHVEQLNKKKEAKALEGDTSSPVAPWLDVAERVNGHPKNSANKDEDPAKERFRNKSSNLPRTENENENEDLDCSTKKMERSVHKQWLIGRWFAKNGEAKVNEDTRNGFQVDKEASMDLIKDNEEDIDKLNTLDAPEPESVKTMEAGNKSSSDKKISVSDQFAKMETNRSRKSTGEKTGLARMADDYIDPFIVAYFDEPESEDGDENNASTTSTVNQVGAQPSTRRRWKRYLCSECCCSII